MTERNVNDLDWKSIGAELDREGHAVLPGLVNNDEIQTFLAECSDWPETSNIGANTFDLGSGSTRQLLAPLPRPLDTIAAELYEPLALITNRWQALMGTTTQFPPTLEEFERQLVADGLKVPQATLTRLLPGEYDALRQTPPQDHAFRLEIAVLLSDPGRGFTGGEFVMTEQRPRMQSRPIVVPLMRGDAVVMAAGHRPFKGSMGTYRVNMKHAISRVLTGQRLGIVIGFHDARGARDHD